jgi:predicted ATPase/class 3 adenylate cyclase
MPDLPIGTVTFLFTDIEGSTDLARRLGPHWPEVLEAHHALVRRAIRGHRGVDVRTEGDAFFAVFPSAADAAAAVAEAQRTIAQHPWRADAVVRVRMGLHTGEGRLGGDEYVGLDVHRAARIAAAAHGGQVLLSESTKGLVVQALPPGTSLRDLGPHRLKDFDEPEHLYQLTPDGLRADYPPLRTPDAPTNLPAELSSFVGREEQIRQVTQLLGDTRLLTLTGPGGAGKSRLAVRVAAGLRDRFPNGAFFVDLASIRDPLLVPWAIASTIGAREMGPRGIMEVLEIELRHRELLLVLDNFEQVIEAATVVSALLAGAPKVTVLVTSRGPLRVRGEQEFQVPPLDLPDPLARPSPEEVTRYEAVALFAQRAAAVDPAFVVDEDNVAAVVEICRRLDGLPLAIELAASRIRLLSPAAMLARFDHALPLLEAGPRDAPDRQRTLRGAIAWSYDLLPPDIATVFRRMCVFSGSFDLDAVSKVCTPQALGVDSLAAMETLVDAGLARGRSSPVPEPRFDLLQTVREFGVERLTEEGEEPDLRRRHAGYFLDLAEAAAPGFRGPDLQRSLVTIQLDHDNIRSALSWALETDEGAVALGLVASAWRFWHLNGDLTVGRTWAEEAVALPSAAAPSALRAKALIGVASLAYWQLDGPAMVAACEEALDISRDLEDAPGTAEAMYNLAFGLSLVGKVPEAAAMLQEVRARFEALGDHRGVADSLFGLSVMARLLGDLEEARSNGEEGLRMHREAGDLFGAYGALFIVGRAAAETGDLDTSRDYFLQALDMAEAFGDRTGVALSVDNLADQELRRGHADRAMRLFGASEAIKEGVGGQAPPELLQLADPVERVRPILSEEAIRSAWQEGRAMSLAQALAYVREPA